MAVKIKRQTLSLNNDDADVAAMRYEGRFLSTCRPVCSFTETFQGTKKHDSTFPRVQASCAKRAKNKSVWRPVGEGARFKHEKRLPV